LERCLSPLVATAILISATIVGGIMLYQYFTQTINSFTSEESLVFSIAVRDLGSNQAMFFYTIRNTGTVPVTISKIIVYNGADVACNITVNKFLGAGAKFSGSYLATEVTPSPGMFAVIEYVVNGQTLLSKPVPVTSS